MPFCKISCSYTFWIHHKLPPDISKAHYSYHKICRWGWAHHPTAWQTDLPLTYFVFVWLTCTCSTTFGNYFYSPAALLHMITIDQLCKCILFVFVSQSTFSSNFYVWKVINFRLWHDSRTVRMRKLIWYRVLKLVRGSCIQHVQWQRC